MNKEIDIVNQPDIKQQKNKKKSIKVIFIIIILVLLVLGIGYYFYFNKDKEINNKSPEKEFDNTINFATSEIRINGNGLENFDLSFLKINNNGKDIVYSPLSIKYALEMLSEGASGESKSQIDAVLGEYTTKKYINSDHMSFANALFVKDTYKNNIKDSYITTLKNKYNAEVINDAFDSSSTVNSWVKKNTFDLVDNIIEDNDIKNLDFALINALAIDMKWVYQIQYSYVPDNDSEGRRFSVSYEHETCNGQYDCIWGIGEYDYEYSTMTFNDNQVRAAKIGTSINRYNIINVEGRDSIYNELITAYEEHKKDEPLFSYTEEEINKYIEELSENYGKIEYSTDFYFNVTDTEKIFAKDLREYNGTTLEYIGIMPTTKDLTAYINEIDASKINELMNGLKDASNIESYKEGVVTQIYGYIPMFSNNYELNLIDNLKYLGINNIFESGKADLTNLVTNANSEYISTAKHKTNIEFSNEGIKAAAVTMSFGAGSVHEWEYYFDVPVEIIDLTFDKPYMYIIRDKDSGEVWFAGTVYNPTLMADK